MKHASCVSASPCCASVNKEFWYIVSCSLPETSSWFSAPKRQPSASSRFEQTFPPWKRRIACLNVSKKCFCPINRTKATFRTASSHMLTRRIKQPQSARQGFPGTPLQIATHTILYHYKAVFASLSSFFALVVLYLDLTYFSVLKGNGHKKSSSLYLKEKPSPYCHNRYVIHFPVDLCVIWIYIYTRCRVLLSIEPMQGVWQVRIVVLFFFRM